MAAIEGKITSVSIVPLDEAGTPTGPAQPLVGFRDAVLNRNAFTAFEENFIRPIEATMRQINLTFQLGIEAMMSLFGPLLVDLYRRRAVRCYGVPESDIRRVDVDGTVHLYNWRKIDCSTGPAWDQM